MSSNDDAGRRRRPIRIPEDSDDEDDNETENVSMTKDDRERKRPGKPALAKLDEKKSAALYQRPPVPWQVLDSGIDSGKIRIRLPTRDWRRALVPPPPLPPPAPPIPPVRPPPPTSPVRSVPVPAAPIPAATLPVAPLPTVRADILDVKHSIPNTTPSRPAAISIDLTSVSPSASVAVAVSGRLNVTHNSRIYHFSPVIRLPYYPRPEPERAPAAQYFYRFWQRVFTGLHPVTGEPDPELQNLFFSKFEAADSGRPQTYQWLTALYGSPYNVVSFLVWQSLGAGKTWILLLIANLYMQAWWTELGYYNRALPGPPPSVPRPESPTFDFVMPIRYPTPAGGPPGVEWNWLDPTTMLRTNTRTDHVRLVRKPSDPKYPKYSKIKEHFRTKLGVKRLHVFDEFIIGDQTRKIVIPIVQDVLGQFEHTPVEWLENDIAEQLTVEDMKIVGSMTPIRDLLHEIISEQVPGSLTAYLAFVRGKQAVYGKWTDKYDELVSNLEEELPYSEGWEDMSGTVMSGTDRRAALRLVWNYPSITDEQLHAALQNVPGVNPATVPLVREFMKTYASLLSHERTHPLFTEQLNPASFSLLIAVWEKLKLVDLTAKSASDLVDIVQTTFQSVLAESNTQASGPLSPYWNSAVLLLVSLLYKHQRVFGDFAPLAAAADATDEKASAVQTPNPVAKFGGRAREARPPKQKAPSHPAHRLWVISLKTAHQAAIWSDLKKVPTVWKDYAQELLEPSGATQPAVAAASSSSSAAAAAAAASSSASSSGKGGYKPVPNKLNRAVRFLHIGEFLTKGRFQIRRGDTILVDEAHLLADPDPREKRQRKRRYFQLYKVFWELKRDLDIKFVLMTATPFRSQPYRAGALFNLLADRPYFPDPTAANTRVNMYVDLFSEDEMVVDPVVEARIQALWDKHVATYKTYLRGIISHVDLEKSPEVYARVEKVTDPARHIIQVPLFPRDYDSTSMQVDEKGAAAASSSSAAAAASVVASNAPSMPATDAIRLAYLAKMLWHMKKKDWDPAFNCCFQVRFETKKDKGAKVLDNPDVVMRIRDPTLIRLMLQTPKKPIVDEKNLEKVLLVINELRQWQRKQLIQRWTAEKFSVSIFDEDADDNEEGIQTQLLDYWETRRSNIVQYRLQRHVVWRTLLQPMLDVILQLVAWQTWFTMRWSALLNRDKTLLPQGRIAKLFSKVLIRDLASHPQWRTAFWTIPSGKNDDEEKRNPVARALLKSYEVTTGRTLLDEASSKASSSSARRSDEKSPNSDSDNDRDEADEDVDDDDNDDDNDDDQEKADEDDEENATIAKEEIWQRVESKEAVARDLAQYGFLHDTREKREKNDLRHIMWYRGIVAGVLWTRKRLSTYFTDAKLALQTITVVAAAAMDDSKVSKLQTKIWDVSQANIETTRVFFTDSTYDSGKPTEDSGGAPWTSITSTIVVAATIVKDLAALRAAVSKKPGLKDPKLALVLEWWGHVETTLENLPNPAVEAAEPFEPKTGKQKKTSTKRSRTSPTLKKKEHKKKKEKVTPKTKTKTKTSTPDRKTSSTPPPPAPPSRAITVIDRKTPSPPPTTPAAAAAAASSRASPIDIDSGSDSDSDGNGSMFSSDDDSDSDSKSPRPSKRPRKSGGAVSGGSLLPLFRIVNQGRQGGAVDEDEGGNAEDDGDSGETVALSAAQSVFGRFVATTRYVSALVQLYEATLRRDDPLAVHLLKPDFLASVWSGRSNKALGPRQLNHLIHLMNIPKIDLIVANILRAPTVKHWVWSGDSVVLGQLAKALVAAGFQDFETTYVRPELIRRGVTNYRLVESAVRDICRNLPAIPANQKTFLWLKEAKDFLAKRSKGDDSDEDVSATAIERPPPGLERENTAMVSACFNHKENYSAPHAISVVMAGPPFRESISLSNVQEVHIVDEQPFDADQQQAVRRAVRFRAQLPNTVVHEYDYMMVFQEQASEWARALDWITHDQYYANQQIEQRLKRVSIENDMRRMSMDCVFNAALHKVEAKQACWYDPRDPPEDPLWDINTELREDDMRPTDPNAPRNGQGGGPGAKPPAFLRPPVLFAAEQNVWVHPPALLATIPTLPVLPTSIRYDDTALVAARSVNSSSMSSSSSAAAAAAASASAASNTARHPSLPDWIHPLAGGRPSTLVEIDARRRRAIAILIESIPITDLTRADLLQNQTKAYWADAKRRAQWVRGIQKTFEWYLENVFPVFHKEVVVALQKTTAADGARRIQFVLAWPSRDTAWFGRTDAAQKVPMATLEFNMRAIVERWTENPETTLSGFPVPSAPPGIGLLYVLLMTIEHEMLHLILNWTTPDHCKCNAGHSPLFCQLLANVFGHTEYADEHSANIDAPTLATVAVGDAVSVLLNLHADQRIRLTGRVQYLSPLGAFCHVQLDRLLSDTQMYFVTTRDAPSGPESTPKPFRVDPTTRLLPYVEMSDIRVVRNREPTASASSSSSAAAAAATSTSSLSQALEKYRRRPDLPTRSCIDLPYYWSDTQFDDYAWSIWPRAARPASATILTPPVRSTLPLSPPPAPRSNLTLSADRIGGSGAVDDNLVVRPIYVTLPLFVSPIRTAGHHQQHHRRRRSASRAHRSQLKHSHGGASAAAARARHKPDNRRR